MEKLNFFEKRTFGENFNFVINFIKQNFIHFSLNIILVNLPAFLIFGLVVYLMQDSFADIPSSLKRGTPGDILGLLSIMFLLVFLYASYSVCAIFNYYILYDQKGSSNFHFMDIIQSTFKSLGRVMIANLLFGIILIIVAIFAGIIMAGFRIAGFFGIFLGITGFIVGVVWLAVRLSFTWVAIIRENKNLIEAISRSFYLVKNNFWETLGLLVVFSIISFLISSMIQSIILTVTNMNEEYTRVLMGNYGPSFLLIGTFLIIQILNVIINTLLTNTVLFTQYGSLVDSKEKVNLKGKLDNFGKDASSSSSPQETEDSEDY